MSTKKPVQEEGFNIKIPQTLTLKDLITVVSIAVSLALAWGVFSTRITVLEKELVSVQALAKQQQSDIDELRRENRRLESVERDNTLFIDQLFGLARKLPPRRANN